MPNQPPESQPVFRLSALFLLLCLFSSFPVGKPQSSHLSGAAIGYIAGSLGILSVAGIAVVSYRRYCKNRQQTTNTASLGKQRSAENVGVGKSDHMAVDLNRRQHPQTENSYYELSCKAEEGGQLCQQTENPAYGLVCETGKEKLRASLPSDLVNPYAVSTITIDPQVVYASVV